MTVDRTLLAGPFNAWAEQVEALGFFSRGHEATEDQVKAALRFDLASCGVDTVDPETFAVAAAGMAVGMKAMLVACMAPGAVSVPAVIAHQVALGRLMIGLADEPAADLSGLDWEPASWPSLDAPEPEPEIAPGALEHLTYIGSPQHPCANCGRPGLVNLAGERWICADCWVSDPPMTHLQRLNQARAAAQSAGPFRPQIGGPSFQRNADDPPYLAPDAPQPPSEPSRWRKAVLGAIKAVEKAVKP